MKNFRKIADGTITYHVDEANRVVVAFMYDTEYIALDYILEHASPYKEKVFITPLFAECDEDTAYLMMSSSYSARARCHPEDEFDVEVGKSLARKKLLQNVHRAFSKRLRRYAKHLDETRAMLVENLDHIEI